jgi:hypothetical protein
VIFSAWTMCGVALRLVALVGDVVEHHIDGPTDDDFAINPGHAVPVPDLRHQTRTRTHRHAGFQVEVNWCRMVIW